jgi:hypothetical protein
LEVHYHPGKANVVADALSRKDRCNHITVQPHPSCCDPEEPSLRVILHDRLNNIALIPTIKEDIIAAQRTLEWVISDKDWNHEKLNTSDKMSMEFCGSKTVSLSEDLQASS